MTAITQGNSATVEVPYGRTLQVTSAGKAVVSAKEGFGLSPGMSWNVTPGVPFKMLANPGTFKVEIRAESGEAKYTQFSPVLGYDFNFEPFTGDRTLTADDNGNFLRCDDDEDVTITVPADLPETFSCGLAMWGEGTVTVEAGSGATKRSSTSELATQYQAGSVIVLKNADNESAEFILGGDFA